MASSDEGPRLADIGEDELLAQIFPILARSGEERVSSQRPSTAEVLVGPGDDAAVIAGIDRLVVTTDTMVRDRDWRDAWSSAAEVGGKIVAQNLADVAAMGAEPVGLLVTLVTDSSLPLDWALELSRGIAQAAGAVGARVLGGDLSSAPDGMLAVSVTAFGDLGDRAPVLRSGARPGDVLAIGGGLGRADAGWRLLAAGPAGSAPETDGADTDNTGTGPAAAAVAWQRCPRPSYALGPAAAQAGATAMLDVSDGLLRDAGRIARASGVSIDVQTSALAPFVDALASAVGPQQALESVLTGGEEHSMLATFPPHTAVPAGFVVIGEVGEARTEPVVTVDGAPHTRSGWDHFGG